MPEGHRHLTRDERCQTGALKESGLSDGATAARLGRDRTSVWRELRRNGGGGGYSPGEAQGRAEARRSAASGVPPKDDARPVGACGGASGGGLEPGAGRGTAASRGWLDGGPPVDIRACEGRQESGRGAVPAAAAPRQEAELAWRQALGPGPHPGPRRHLREAGRGGERIGDREAGTVIGRGHSGAVVSLVDRASGFVFLQRVDRRTSREVGAAMLEMLRPSAAPVHTVTADNGREFAGHAGVAAKLGAAFHFATP